MYTTSKSNHTPKVHNIALDGLANIHLLKPIGTYTFEDNAHQIFLSSRMSFRIEVMWDEYKPSNLTFLFQRGDER